jgi:hypothetical protein
LRDWLDAGEAMLMQSITDPVAADLFSRLFRADTEAAMEAAFTELRQVGEAFEAEARKATDKRRRDLGVSRVVAADDLAAAAAEWGYQPPEQVEPDRGDAK